MPFFSVLMPTRNRANLLADSLKTAVGQDFQDYEIIVSDNNSVDHTKEVIMDTMRSCDKVQYINPGADLSMLDHWEFILNHAKGEYIIYLCDDDALIPCALSRIYQVLTKHPIDILVWKRGYYHHPDVPDDNLKGSLRFRLWDGGLYQIQSNLATQMFYDFDTRIYEILPKMLNCVVSKKVIDACKEKTSIFFVPPYPDYSAACHLLGASKTYYLIDAPLYICGISSASNAGLQYGRKQKYHEYLSLFSHDLLEGVPYAMKYLNTTYFLGTQYTFQTIYGNSYSKINFDSYFKTLLKELSFLSKYEDIAEELKQIESYMADYYRSKEQFSRFFSEAFQPTLSSEVKKRLLGLIKRVLQISPRLYETTEKAFQKIRKRSTQTPLYQNVESVFRASLILNNFLLQKASTNPLEIEYIDTMPAMEKII